MSGGTSALTGRLSQQRLPGIDGLRAVAIGLVLVCHFVVEGIRPSGTWKLVLLPATTGDLGVQLFFVLSGFLITSILLMERGRTGRVDLYRFFMRRALRIWPAFYCFLGALALLVAVHAIDIRGSEFITAGLFLRNYSMSHEWWLGHSWSLAVEEQFYLIWPVLLVLIRPRRLVGWVAAGIAVSPLIRVATYLVASGVDQRMQIPQFLHTRADTLLVGCFLAILKIEHAQEFDWLSSLTRRFRLGPVAVVVLLLSTCVSYAAGGYWDLTLGWTLENLALGALLVSVLDDNGLKSHHILTSGFATAIGRISFSLYLWQQLFYTDRSWLFRWCWPLALLMPFVIAALSYRLIEQPFLRIKDNLFAARTEKSLGHFSGAVDTPAVQSPTPSPENAGAGTVGADQRDWPTSHREHLQSSLPEPATPSRTG